MKKFLSILLATMMVLAMVGTAFADETPTTYSITIQNSVEGYKYGVYQVFTGEFEGEKLKSVEWGSGVDQTALLPKLVSAGVIDSYETGKEPSAQDVALKLSDGNKEAFATAVSECLKTTVTTIDTSSNGQYVATGLPAGYYFVKSTDKPQNGTDSAYILVVADHVITAVKNGKVEHTKKVKDQNDTTDVGYTSWQDSADHDIGDSVPFQLKGTLPADYDSFESYKYVFHDKMSAGLTFDASSVKVYNGTTEITDGYTVKCAANNNAPTDGCTFEIEFADLKQVNGVTATSVIYVEFNATLNDNAVVGDAGNPNVSYLEFSNDAKDTSATPSTGKTPEDKVIVFTYKVIVNKVDQTGKPLEGATFKLEKKLAGGTMKLLELVTADNMTFSFKGLDDGEYVLTEVDAPDGYNGLTAAINFTVTGTHDTESADPKLTKLEVTAPFSVEIKTGTLEDASDDEITGNLSTDVVNKSGASLPETGGIGTTLFYLFGGLMTAGSALMLVVRRRAEAEEE